MMKKLLSVIVLLASFLAKESNAQIVWCPPGAKWVFNDYWFTGSGVNECIYSGDTSYNGNSVKKISCRYSYTNLGVVTIDSVYKTSAFTFLRNDSVFLGNTLSDMQMIYRFGLSPGDTFYYRYAPETSFCLSDSSVRLIVDSVGVYNQYGVNLSYYDCTFADTSISNMIAYPDSRFPRIVERLGTQQGFFRPSTFCYIDENYPTLCYYEDDSTVHDTVAYNNCKRLVSSVNELSIDNYTFEVFPNPASGILQISGNVSFIKAVKIIDFKGAEVYSVKEEFDSFNVKNLNTGLYFVKIITDKTIVYKMIQIAD